jgi:hypothetical protein
VRLTIAGGSITRVEALGARQLQKDIEAVIGLSHNSARVGIVGIGVNEGVASPVGDVAVDVCFPSLHLFVGDPASKATGATWTAATSFAVCQGPCRLTIAGAVVLEGGRIAQGT